MRIVVCLVTVLGILKIADAAVKLRVVKDRCEVQGVQSFEDLRDMADMDFENSSNVVARTKLTEDGNVTKIMCPRLRFVNSTFNEFPVNFFEKLVGRDVREIIARDVGLNSINQDDFKSAGNVWSLKISTNHIETLNEKSFVHLEGLRYLDLSSNAIRNIHPDAFDGLTTNFSKIDLSRNKLLNFKEKFFLDMSRNEDGPEILLNNNEIHIVEPINFIDSLSLQKRKVKLLDLSSNMLRVFTVTSLNFTSLKLNNNTIEKLITPIVTELEVSDNKLQEIFISNSIVNLTAANNRINEVQCERSLKLERLRLGRNNIFSDVFQCIKFSRYLKTLDLSHNPIGYLNVDVFTEVVNLEELNMANTELKKITYGVLGYQNNLRMLDISDNDLGKLDYFVLASLKNLEVLDISGNRMKEFKGYKKLKDLSRNMQYIGLENNNFKCDYLGKMWIFFNRKKISVLPAKNPLKTKANIGGVRCLTKSEKDEEKKVKY